MRKAGGGGSCLCCGEKAWEEHSELLTWCAEERGGQDRRGQDRTVLLGRERALNPSQGLYHSITFFTHLTPSSSF